MVESLATALVRQHHEVDQKLEEFTATLAGPAIEVTPMRQAATALRRHIYLEEAFLFPPLRDGGLIAPIFVMLREHGQLWRTLDAIDAEIALGPDEVALRKSCKELVVRLQHHNQKEEQILYPQAGLALDEPATAQLRGFMESGTLPKGWSCERA